MCTVINADCVLANALCGNRREVSIRDLNAILMRLETIFSDVHVDISMETILWAVDQRPDMFGWREDIVRRVDDSDSRFSRDYVDHYFNWRIPETMRTQFVESCHV
jgi:hypothetical protein